MLKYTKAYTVLAQLAERHPFKLGDVGSTPTGGTKFMRFYYQYDGGNPEWEGSERWYLYSKLTPVTFVEEFRSHGDMLNYLTAHFPNDTLSIERISIVFGLPSM